MTPRTTFRLLVLIAVLAGLIWVLDRHWLTVEAPKRQESRLFAPYIEDAQSIHMKRGASEISLLHQKGAWFLERPIKSRGNPEKVERILSTMEALPVFERVTGEQRRLRALEFTDYGLTATSPCLTIVCGQRKDVVRIGARSASGDMLYVRVGEDPDVVATSLELLSALPSDINELRDRSLIEGDSYRTARFEIARPDGSVQLVKSGAAWVIQRPVNFRADTAQVNRMLDVLFSTAVSEFVWDPKAMAAADESGGRDSIETYGLAADEAALRIRVWVNGDEVGQELIVGKNVPGDKGLVYAKLRDRESVVAINGQVAAAFRVGVNDLRDRRLFVVSSSEARYFGCAQGDRRVGIRKDNPGGWTIVEPLQWRADDETVGAIVDAVAGMSAISFESGVPRNLKELGMDPPWCLVHLSATASREEQRGAESGSGQGGLASEPSMRGKELDRVWLSNVIQSNGTVLARYDGTETYFWVASDAITRLGRAPSEPLVYRDRRMMAIPPEAVSRLTLRRGGLEQRVALVSTGNVWIAEQPSGIADRTAIQDVLGLLANVRALRIEYHGVENLEAFGLDKDATVLVVSLSGGEGIQKSLLMGFRARTDGVYAMVQGQDLVFVLAKDVVERLCVDLVKAPPRATNGRP